MFSLTVSVEALVLLSIGGRSRLWGAITGTALVIFALHLSPWPDLDRGLIVGLFGVVILILFPGGLFGIPDQIRRATWTFR